MLTTLESKIFAGWIVYRNLKRKNTTTNNLETFLRLKFGLYPSKSWFSKFCKRNHFSFRTTAVAKWSENSKSKWNEAVKYIKSTREDIKLLKLPLNKVACFDKTKFRLFSEGAKQVGIKGGCVVHSSLIFLPILIIIEANLAGLYAKTLEALSLSIQP